MQRTKTIYLANQTNKTANKIINLKFLDARTSNQCTYLLFLVE